MSHTNPAHKNGDVVNARVLGHSRLSARDDLLKKLQQQLLMRTTALSKVLQQQGVLKNTRREIHPRVLACGRRSL